MTEENNDQQVPEADTPKDEPSPESQEGQEDEEGESNQGTTEVKEEINVMAVLCYLAILIVVPLLTDHREQEFVRFHIKQGLMLLITGVVAMFIGAITIFEELLIPVIAVAWIVFAAIGVVNVIRNQKKPLPLIGEVAQRFKV